MYLKKGDLIQFNVFYHSDWNPEWVMGLVLGPHPKHQDTMRVFWFDDYQETEEPNPREGEEYKMFSPGSSVG